MLIIAICAVIAVTASVLLLTLVGKGNGGVVFSSDFENGRGKFTTDAYVDNVTTFSYKEDGGVDNSACLMIESAEANDARFITEVKVRAGKYYRITGSVKAENITGENAYGANISVIASLVRHPYPAVKADGQWHDIEYYVKAPTGGTMKLALRLGYYGGDTAGRAWFDNVAVTQVDKIPEGAVYIDLHTQAAQAPAVTEGAEWNENTYSDTKIIACIAAAVLLLFFLIVYRYARVYDGFGLETPVARPSGKTVSLRTGIIALLAFALVLRLVLSVTYFQCDIDVNLFKYWGNRAFEVGLTNVYNKVPGIDYPPLFIHYLWMASGLSRLFAPLLGGAKDAFYTMLVKLPAGLADCAIGYIIYRIAKKKRMSNEWCLFFAAVWLFNPLAILDSAFWGQVDSLTALCVILCIYLLNEKRYFVSGIILGVGVMLKPQMIIFTPVFFYMWLKEAIRNRSGKNALKTLGLSAGGGIAGALAPNLMFLGMGLTDVTLFEGSAHSLTLRLPWIFSLFSGTVNHYNYATVNCYNFWFLLGKNWTSDSMMFGPLSFHTWGMLAIVLVSLVTLVLYLKSKDAEYMPYLLAAFLYLGVSDFGPRMHERYFFPAVSLLLIVAILANKKVFLGIYSFLSVAGFLSVFDVMVGLQVGSSLRAAGASGDRYGDYYWPSLNLYRGIIAAAMVISFLLVTVFAFLAAFAKDRNLGRPIFAVREETDAETKEVADE